MQNTLSTRNGQPLLMAPDLADRINAEHEAACNAASQAIVHAMNAGDLLAEAKSQLGHGEWLPWLEANFSLTPRTAQTYMRLAGNRDKIEGSNAHRGSHLSVREAVRLLAPPSTCADRGIPLLARHHLQADEAELPGFPSLDGMTTWLLHCGERMVELLPSERQPGCYMVRVIPLRSDDGVIATKRPEWLTHRYLSWLLVQFKLTYTGSYVALQVEEAAA